ncbi:MAG: hypothetical protein ACYTF6_12485, partial [Planctomycetota bacterium]
MSRKRILQLTAIFLPILAGIAACYYALRPSAITIESYTDAGRLPSIRPDYVGTKIPPNIAPLNFCIEEAGDGYCVRIRSKVGGSIEIFSETPRISIPRGKWRRLLNANRGNDLFFEIYAMGQDGNWTRYETVTNRIANEDIDGYLVYRLLKPNYNFYYNIGIYQRELAGWDESVVLDGQSFRDGCVNCHTFKGNSPKRMFVGIRSSVYGSATLFA